MSLLGGFLKKLFRDSVKKMKKVLCILLFITFSESNADNTRAYTVSQLEAVIEITQSS